LGLAQMAQRFDCELVIADGEPKLQPIPTRPMKRAARIEVALGHQDLNGWSQAEAAGANDATVEEPAGKAAAVAAR
jgi:hypothetical protein